MSNTETPSGKHSLIKEFKTLDRPTKVKLVVFLVLITLIIFYPVYHIVSNKIVENKGKTAWATVYDKSRILGGKPLNYSYYLEIKYYDAQKKLQTTSLGVARSRYNNIEKGDSIRIKYLPWNHEVEVKE